MNMTVFDERRCTAILYLPALPRALFLPHNFYGVEVGAIAEELGTDRDTINACLADARAIVRARVCYRPATRHSVSNRRPAGGAATRVSAIARGSFRRERLSERD